MYPHDKEKTAFITDTGAFYYRVMPFGLKTLEQQPTQPRPTSLQHSAWSLPTLHNFSSRSLSQNEGYLRPSPAPISTLEHTAINFKLFSSAIAIRSASVHFCASENSNSTSAAQANTMEYLVYHYRAPKVPATPSHLTVDLSNGVARDLSITSQMEEGGTHPEGLGRRPTRVVSRSTSGTLVSIAGCPSGTSRI
ncbi:hypothetical protein CR513_35905, partial [Mucuna pruriens]